MAKKRTLTCETNAANREWAKTAHPASLGSQSKYRIRIILPAHRFSHVILNSKVYYTLYPPSIFSSDNRLQLISEMINQCNLQISYVKCMILKFNVKLFLCVVISFITMYNNNFINKVWIL